MPDIKVPRTIPAGPYWNLTELFIGTDAVSPFMLGMLDDANAAAARATLELGTAALTSYTESTFTPALAGLTTPGSPTYTDRGGSYVKVGRLVMAHTYMVVSALGGLTGQLTITGLPFAVRSGVVRRSLWQPSFWSGLTLPAGSIGLYGFGIGNDTTIRLYRQTLTSSTTSLTHSDVSGTLTLYGTTVYEAA